MRFTLSDIQKTGLPYKVIGGGKDSGEVVGSGKRNKPKTSKYRSQKTTFDGKSTRGRACGGREVGYGGPLATASFAAGEGDGRQVECGHTLSSTVLATTAAAAAPSCAPPASALLELQ